MGFSGIAQHDEMIRELNVIMLFLVRYPIESFHYFSGSD